MINDIKNDNSIDKNSNQNFNELIKNILNEVPKEKESLVKNYIIKLLSFNEYRKYKNNKFNQVTQIEMIVKSISIALTIRTASVAIIGITSSYLKKTTVNNLSNSTINIDNEQIVSILLMIAAGVLTVIVLAMMKDFRNKK